MASTYISINPVKVVGTDIAETTFAAANNVAVAADITGLAFANGSVRGFTVQLTTAIDATADLYEYITIVGIQKGAAWTIGETRVGDTSNLVFTITAAGQIQYTSGNETGFASNTIKFRAETVGV